jgi:hypothetical protein
MPSITLPWSRIEVGNRRFQDDGYAVLSWDFDLPRCEQPLTILLRDSDGLRDSHGLRDSQIAVTTRRTTNANSGYSNGI